jgi:N-acyl-D-amino-acid deacylase
MTNLKISRKRIGQALRLLVLGLVLVLAGLSSALAAQTPPLPITGMPVPGLEIFDRLMIDWITQAQIPGGALAIAKDERLVYVRGFGFADKENNEAVQPVSLFRTASISKPITSVAVLKLVEEGKLDLDAKVFCPPEGSCLLAHLQPPPGVPVGDPRLYDVTVRHLLYHVGGWNRDRSGDPMFVPITTRAAKALDISGPPSCEVIIRYMLSQSLDFAPSTNYAYSNFGYCILGRVIEKVTGQSYEDFAKIHMLQPMGVTRMRIGRTLPEGRAEGEVKYYHSAIRPCVFPGMGECPTPYGAFYLEAMDSHGGWIASAIDLLRFATAVDGRRPPAFLKPETVRLMLSPYWPGPTSYYAMGWAVQVMGDGANWSHDGALDGTRTFLFRRHDGLAWALLFNSRAGLALVNPMLQQAANQVTEWPTHDLFAQYP